MVQFKVLSGKQAGTDLVTRRFPVHIGRGSAATLRLDDPGVWENHLRVDFRRQHGFELTAETDALVLVNDQPAQAATTLRNGDVITLGSAKVQFWLAATRQKPLGAREVFTWILIALISLLQVALVYFLLKLS